MKTEKLRVGIAGFGIVGKKRKICIDKNLHMEVVAISDQHIKKNGLLEDGISYFTTYEEMLKVNLDVLFICLSNDVAAEATILGLKSNLHVFCEKPPGRNVTEIYDIIKVQKSFPHLKLMYGFNHRYHDSVKEARKIIASGELGKILNLRGVYGKSKIITFNQSDWRTKREIAGGGVLLDQGIHMVDLMRLFAGEFTEVYSFISNDHWKYDVEDNAYALMRSNDGIVATLNSSATQWRHRFNLDINLERGSLVLDGILSGTKSYGAEKLTVVRVNHDDDCGDPWEQTTRYNYDPSWSKEVNKFCECIINNTPVTRGSSIDAFETMKLVYKIYYADQQWRDKYNIENPEDYSL